MKSKYTFFFLGAVALLLSACGKKTQESKVERRNITEYVFATGVLEPESQYNLTAQNDGYLIALGIEEGDLVAAGQVLAVIDNPQNKISSGSAQELLSIARDNAAADAPALRQVEANIAAAQDKVSQDELQVERFRKLLASNSVSKVEYENMQLSLSSSRANLEALRQQLASLKRQAEQQVVVQRSQSDVNQVLAGNNAVKAILPGKVYRRFKQLGDFVRRGEVIAVIGTPDTLHARLSVDEGNIGKIRLGQPAQVRLNVDNDHGIGAIVNEIRPAFDEATQSFFVEARFVDSLAFKISGTQLEANIETGKRKQVLVVPRNYLTYGDMVRVKREEGEVKQAVKTGFVSSEWVEILEGLKEGETIVTDMLK
ncbi:MAG TPA: HlyD family efflux transporter periplasmic adaptor subunit [Bacteroidia bacterium]|nr:HlyD family efflux transporter periplasmic adaptor subunit [Bacteroidia bacterium]